MYFTTCFLIILEGNKHTVILNEYCLSQVLGLAGIVFFIDACIVMYFELVIKPVLITLLKTPVFCTLMRSACTASHFFFFFSLLCPPQRVGMMCQKLGGGIAGTADPN